MRNRIGGPIAPPTTRVRRVGTGMVVVATVVVAGLAACGGTGSGGGATATTRSSGGVGASTAPRASAGTTASGSPRGVGLEPARWSLPAPVSREVAVTDGRDLYVAGGLDAAGVSTSAVWRVEPGSGRAIPVGTLVYAVHDAMGVWHEGRIVVVAGGTPPVRAEVQVVTPGGTTKVVGRLPEARADHVVVEIGGTLYAFGGGDEAARLIGSVVASDDGGATWRAAGSLVEAVRYPAVAVVDGAVYLFGGVSTTGGTDTTAIQRYDPRAGRTTIVARLPSPLSHSTAIVLDGAVYLLGGYVDNRLGAQVWRFDPRVRATTDAGVTLTAPRSDAAAVVIDGVGYLVGGQGPDKQPVAAVTLVRPRSERRWPTARVRGGRSALFAGRIGRLHTVHA